jgi:HAD superfamily hydrolase (TIGR01662 family)
VIRAVLFDFGETLVERVSDEIRPLTEQQIVPFQDAAPTLRRLHDAGIRVGIVSNTTQTSGDDLTRVLRTLGLEACVDAVVTSFDAGRTKPHPSVFLRALRKVEVSPEQAMMVGDDPVADIGGAAALGMITVRVLRREPHERSPAGPSAPTFVVRCLAEIPGLLGIP